MNSEWNISTIGDIATNESRSFDFNNQNQVVFLNTGDVLEGEFLKNEYIQTKGLPGQAKKAIRQKDILFSEIRPINKRYAYVDFDVTDYVVSTKFMVIQAGNLIIPEYLYLVITSNNILREFQTIAESRSGTFPQITFNSIAHISIKLPPFSAQKKIVHILSILDDKIKLNKKMNQTFEEIAQTLFKSWFVDFDPVHAKANASSDTDYGLIAKELGISREI